MRYAAPRMMSLAACCFGCVLAATLATPALAQLTSADIAALQARGEKEGWTFTVGENDATQYSLNDLCGTRVPENWREGARFEPSYPTRDLPTSFDWRTYNGCTPIRNQSSCGSCWAFALLGSVESAILLADYTAVDLSEQWLVSCCGLGGCDGEWPGYAANYLLCSGAYQDSCGGYGAVFEKDFPYMAYDVACGCPYPHPYCLTSWAFVGPEWGTPSVAELKQAILDHGPICVCVYANDAFQAYGGGVFNACDNTDINHAVDLVGWDDSQGTNGVWIVRNSWGSGWGEQGYMRMAYNCSRIGYNALFVDYTPAPRTLSFTYPGGRPELVRMGEPTTVRVNAGPALGVPVPGTGQLHYSIDGGAYTTVAMTELAPNEYEGMLPAVSCAATLRWYVSAEEATEGRLTNPSDAPATTYLSRPYTTLPTFFFDTFDTDLGWTVNSSALSSGAWERGIPAGDGTRGDPLTDADGSGWCYLTGNALGDSDVDGGPTRLVSPVFDLSDGGDYRVSFSGWLYNDDNDPNDVLIVWVSRDGGSTWTAVLSLGNTNGWVARDFRITDTVALSAQMRFRFTVQDNPNNSMAEAAVDGFKIYRVDCSYPRGDMNCDGALTFADINPFVNALLDPPAYAATYTNCDRLLADMNNDGVVDFNDINGFVAALVGS